MIKLNNLLGKDYEKMTWKELSDEARERGLNPRLTTFKGIEGAGENDRQKMIEQLTLRDQNRNARIALLVSLTALIFSIVSLFRWW